MLISKVPSIGLIAPVLNAKVKAAVVPLETKALPAGITNFPVVSVAATADWKLAVVLPLNSILPTVWAGIAVAVEFPPFENCNISAASGVVLAGVQLEAVAHEAEPEVAFQT